MLLNVFLTAAHDLSPRLQRQSPMYRKQWTEASFEISFGRLRHPKDGISTIHFSPNVRGGDPEFAPQHNKIIDQIDALVDRRRPLPANRLDNDFYCFFGQLLRLQSRRKAVVIRIPR
jgi:hypothetical protein